MALPIYVYDPTATDGKSKVRGIGRYLQTLHQNFGNEWHFTADVKSIPKESICINPFFKLNGKDTLRKRPGKINIAIVHDVIPLQFPHQFPMGVRGKFTVWRNRRALKKYSLIITDSKQSKKQIVKILDIASEKVKVVYPTITSLFLPHMEQGGIRHPFHRENDQLVPEFSPVKLSHVVSNPQLKNLNQFVIYVGDATWNKNLLTLASAIQLANLPIVCIGKIFSKENQEAVLAKRKPHAEELSLQRFLKLTRDDQRFIFPGYVSDGELLFLYKKATVNILPSYEEGFGYSYLEAGYTATPSVLADRPIFHEIAAEAALFADPRNPRAFGEQLTNIFYDSVLREKMIIKAYDRVQEFRPEVFKARWNQIVSEVSR